MTDPAPPSVLALVPTYNGGAFLTATLASLTAQDYPALRILISDDASTDGTWEVCAAAAARDPRVTAVRQPVRQGWIGNSNALLARVDADFAFFAPHDDVFVPSYVSRLAAALTGAPDVVLAFADTLGYASDGRPLERTAESMARPAGRLRRGLRYVIAIEGDRWIPFRGLVRAEALRRVGGLRASRVGEPDADGRWLFRLNLLGPFVRVAEVLCTKRFGGLSRSWEYSRRVRVATRAAYAREVLDADLDLLERTALLAAVALSVASGALPSGIRARVARVFQRAGV
jgi:GT2 family glycosyltransferase